MLIAAAALVLTMVACSGSTDRETSVPTTGGSTETTNQAATQSTTQATTVPTVEFEEIVLVESDEITVKITAVETDSIFGYTLKAFLENKTDKELMFTLDSVSVNGFMCDPFWASTVAAGMKSNVDISFSKSELEKNGIETVEEIVFTLRVYDNGNWQAEDMINETFTFNP